MNFSLPLLLLAHHTPPTGMSETYDNIYLRRHYHELRTEKLHLINVFRACAPFPANKAKVLFFLLLTILLNEVGILFVCALVPTTRALLKRSGLLPNEWHRTAVSSRPIRQLQYIQAMLL